MQTPTQLASQILLDPSTLTSLLDRMEAKGLLMRVPDLEDRRAIKIALSPLGKSIQPEVEDLIRESNNTILSSLDESEREQFIANLQTIISAAPYTV